MVLERCEVHRGTSQVMVIHRMIKQKATALLAGKKRKQLDLEDGNGRGKC